MLMKVLFAVNTILKGFIAGKRMQKSQLVWILALVLLSSSKKRGFVLCKISHADIFRIDNIGEVYP